MQQQHKNACDLKKLSVKRVLKMRKLVQQAAPFPFFLNLLLELTDSIRILRLFSAKLMKVEATLTRLSQVLARQHFQISYYTLQISEE